MSREYGAAEVFVPGGMPQHTYNPRKNLLLEDHLHRFIKRSSKFISVTGRTKSGKTVLVNRLLPRDKKSVWYDGGTFSSEEAFGKISVLRQIRSPEYP